MRNGWTRECRQSRTPTRGPARLDPAAVVRLVRPAGLRATRGVEQLRMRVASCSTAGVVQRPGDRTSSQRRNGTPAHVARCGDSRTTRRWAQRSRAAPLPTALTQADITYAGRAPTGAVALAVATAAPAGATGVGDAPVGQLAWLAAARRSAAEGGPCGCDVGAMWCSPRSGLAASEVDITYSWLVMPPRTPRVVRPAAPPVTRKVEQLAEGRDVRGPAAYA